MPLPSSVIALAALLLASSHPHQPLRPPPPIAVPNTVAFSPGIITFESLSSFSWEGWSQNFPLNMRKYAIAQLPDGSVDYLASSDRPSMTTPGSTESLESSGMAKYEPELPIAPGTPLYHVTVQQELRTGATERVVRFKVTNYAGVELLSMNFLTTGEGLAEIPVERLVNGLLPFFPSASNERRTITTILLLGTEKVTSTIRRETAGDMEYLEAFLATGERNTQFMMYREWSSPNTHRIFYEYVPTVTPNSDDRDLADTVRFEVTKIKKPGDRIGSEFYWVNHQKTGMNTFQTQFTKTILTPISRSWQQGFGSFAAFMFLPGFQP